MNRCFRPSRPDRFLNFHRFLLALVSFSIISLCHRKSTAYLIHQAIQGRSWIPFQVQPLAFALFYGFSRTRLTCARRNGARIRSWIGRTTWGPYARTLLTWSSPWAQHCHSWCTWLQPRYKGYLSMCFTSPVLHRSRRNKSRKSWTYPQSWSSIQSRMRQTWTLSPSLLFWF